MSFRLGPVGPRGLAALAVTAIVGLGLADHGWATSHRTGTSASLAGGATASGSTPSSRAASRSAGSAGSGTAAGATASSGGAAGAPGPSLSSQSYAQYAFQIWPGSPTAAAKAALTGLTITVHRQSGGLLVTAAVNGQSAGSPHLYRGGARVYVIEAAMGDESGASDYNLGDDGLVVTDAQGRIVQ